ncbi:MAG: SDR family NAD(P)-dependent oxidoreductase [Steroidobacteraceae bacterium]
MTQAASTLPDFSTLQLPADALDGRVIAITGATDGLGRALAVACTAHGAQVILIGRQVKRLEAVEREANALGKHRALLAPLDLEKALAGDYDQIAVALEQQFGRLDGLVHAAAQVGNLAPIEHYDVPGWCRLLHVNLTAPFVLTQVLLSNLRAAPDASILFTSCAQAVRSGPYWGAYAASKAGLDALAHSLAAEWDAGKGPRVNSVDPGALRTRLRRQAYPSADLESLPLPEARVAAFLWLLSGASRGVHGQRIALDAMTADP